MLCQYCNKDRDFIGFMFGNKQSPVSLCKDHLKTYEKDFPLFEEVSTMNFLDELLACTHINHQVIAFANPSLSLFYICSDCGAKKSVEAGGMHEYWERPRRIHNYIARGGKASGESR